MKTKQHISLLVCCPLIVAVGFLLYKVKSYQPKLTTLKKSLNESGERLAFVKREHDKFESPNIELANQKLSAAQGRLRGIKIEGETARGQYISRRPRYEAAKFLTIISNTCENCGLKLLAHTVLNPSGQNMEELIIRELKCQGNYSSLVRFIQKLEALPYRVLILEIQIGSVSNSPGLLDVRLVLSM